MPVTFEDHTSLHALHCDLFRNLDERELDAMAQQYDPSVVVRIFFSREQRQADQAGVVTVGCGQIIAGMKAFFTQVDATHHMLGNFVAETAGGEARVRAALRAYHRGSGDLHGSFEESLASIESRSRRGPDGHWKIIALDYTVLVMLGSTAVFGDTFPQA